MNIHLMGALAVLGLGGLLTPWANVQAAVAISGSQKVWQTLDLTVNGPEAKETDNSPNPFLDLRLNVTFTGPEGQRYVIPGYFDGDGAGEGQGDVWRAKFTPDAPGQWRYQVSFRQASKIAITPSASGQPLADDGASGTLSVAARDPLAPGFASAGRLEYVGRHYFKLRDGGYWLKGGANSPENWLGYSGFDNTPTARHSFSPHVQDWRVGDPNWDSPDTASANDGKGIIGAINYLASRHVNSMYFLPMNIGGDGQDSWPYVGPIKPEGASSNDNLHFDISKLWQWEQVFQHAQRLGILLHVVLNERERENKMELDNATLGTERKLYYREMVARMAHHNALQWNLSEEYQERPGSTLFSAEQITQFAAHVSALDAYAHPMTVHPLGNPNSAAAEREAIVPFLGNRDFDMTSLQYDHKYQNLDAEVRFFLQRSAQAGRPWVVNLDEIASPLDDVSFDQLRRETLWDIYLAGGNLEWYIRGPRGRRLDFHLEDFRPFDELWRYTWYARNFLKRLPIEHMRSDDGLLVGELDEAFGSGSVFAQRGRFYAVYLPDTDGANNGRIDLRDASGVFYKRWYNPRTGQFVGEAEKVLTSVWHEIGPAPAQDGKDWALIFSERASLQGKVLEKLGFQ